MTVEDAPTPSESSTTITKVAIPRISTQGVSFGDKSPLVQSTAALLAVGAAVPVHQLKGLVHREVTESAVTAEATEREEGASTSALNARRARTTALLEPRARETVTLRGAGALAARDTVGVSAGDSRRPIRSSVLAAAMSALQAVLRGAPDVEIWQACARRLRAVTAAEQHRSRRHAALALLLADVLSFSRPEDLRDHETAWNALELGWRALGQPFVSTDVERQVTRDLARAGWQLSLPYRGWISSK